MNKVALVTGSSKGIGKAIAKMLLDNGYIVYINGRNEQLVNDTLLEFNNQNAKPLIVDLSLDENLKNSLSDIFLTESRINLVVCNIGSGKSKLGLEADLQEYKRIFDINFFSAVTASLHSIEYMKPYGGHIVFIGSIAGCEHIGAPLTYSSAKTALISYSKNLSYEVAKYKIRVNCVSPGNVMFDGSTWDNKKKEDDKKVDDYIKNNVPLNTFAIPEDIAKAVLFLEQSDFITGSNIVVDGGQIRKII